MIRSTIRDGNERHALGAHSRGAQATRRLLRTDDEIVDNLRTLRSECDDGCAFVGSVTRADEPMQKLRQSSKIPTRPRGHAAFRPLAERGGFDVQRVIERPFSDHVMLRPGPSHNQAHL